MITSFTDEYTKESLATVRVQVTLQIQTLDRLLTYSTLTPDERHHLTEACRLLEKSTLPLYKASR
jgi:hypothetical protein